MCSDIQLIYFQVPDCRYGVDYAVAHVNNHCIPLTCRVIFLMSMTHLEKRILLPSVIFLMSMAHLEKYLLTSVFPSCHLRREESSERRIYDNVNTTFE